MAENEVIIEVIARLDKAEASLKKFEGTAKDSGQGAGDGFSKGFSTGIKAVAIAAAAAAAAIAIVFKKGIDEAIAGQNAINELNNALARTGQFSQAASLELQSFASALQKNSTFADDVILSNAALIQSLGKLSVGGLKQATQAAADLSAALGIDLRSASTLVGKAAAGEVGSFSRYGVVIKQGADNAETFANALTKLNQSFGGAAAAQAKTFGGSLDQLKNTFSDLIEEIGNLIVKSPPLAGAIRFISGVIERLTESVKQFGDSGGFKDMLTTAIDVASFFTAVLGPVFDVISNVVVSLGKSIGGLAAALVAFVTGDFSGALSILADVSAVAIEDVKTVFSTTGTDAAQGFLTGLRTAVTEAPPLVAEIKNVVQAQAETFSGISFNGFLDSFRMTVEQMNTLAKGVMVQLKTTVVSGVGGAFSAIGGALVKGENAFAAFGKAILGMFGDIAIQLGTFYLTLGFANLFLNPAAAAGQLAGGAALLILGGALKAIGGGGGAAASASASGGGGGSAAAAPIGESASSLQETGNQDPGTAVTVNIQGNVFDRRETGLAIAEIINESFATGGSVIARGAIV